MTDSWPAQSVIISGLLKVIFSYAPNSREPSFNRTEIWTTVHCGIGMVCACLPVCWPLVVRVAKLRPASIQKQWRRLSGWSSMEKSSKIRNTTSSLERNTSTDGDGLLMDDLGNGRFEASGAV